MPRTFQATVALITIIAVLAILALINVWQTHNTEKKIVALERSVQQLAATTSDVKNQLRRGVAVAGQVGGAGAAGGSQGLGADPCAEALADPRNLLKAPTKKLIPADATEGGTLRRDLIADPKGFNFVTENSVTVQELQGYIHESFAGTDFDNPDRYIPALSCKITANDDYTVYTIHLRKGIYWHPLPHPDIGSDVMKWAREPHELTAEDAAFTFEMLTNPQVEAGALKSFVEDLERIEVVDRYTLKLHWKKKTYQSLGISLTMYPMPKWLFTRDKDGTELPEATLGKSFNNHWAADYPIGVGPYKFEKFEKGVRIKLVRNEDYIVDQKPPIKELEYKILKDASHRIREFKIDQLDFLEEMAPSIYKTEILEGKDTPFTDGKFEHKVVDRFAYYFLGWNANKPKFADKNVRRALTHAFNREEMIKKVFFGLGVIQSGPFYYDHPSNDPDVKPLPFDLQLSSQLLDEAGWTDTDGDGIRDKVIDGRKERFEFTILSYGHRPEFQTALSIFKEDLRKIGVILNDSPVDWPTMLKKMDEGKFDAYTGGWGLSWTIDPHQIWHSSQADVPKGSNRIGFRNKEADQIIEELRVTFDDAKRQELARKFHRILHDEQPYTFFFAPKNVIAWNPRVHNLLVRKTRPQFSSIPWYLKQPEKQ